MFPGSAIPLDHRGVRRACVVFIVFLVGSAVYHFAEHQIDRGVLSALICWSPLSLTWIARSLERTVAIPDGPST